MNRNFFQSIFYRVKTSDKINILSISLIILYLILSYNHSSFLINFTNTLLFFIVGLILNLFIFYILKNSFVGLSFLSFLNHNNVIRKTINILILLFLINIFFYNVINLDSNESLTISLNNNQHKINITGGFVKEVSDAFGPRNCFFIWI